MLPGQEPVRPLHPARHVFSMAGVAISVAVIIGGFFGAALYVSSVLTGGNMAAVISATLVDLANGDREAEDLHALTVNPVLVAAAQAKADDMAKEGYFAHTSPDGETPWHWFEVAGYEYAAAGENLAVNFSDSVNVEEAWMNSPAHRANILSGKFTEIGIATARGEYKGKTTTFVVQMFGTPRTSAAAAPREVAVAPENPEEFATTVSRNEPAILGSETATPPAAEPAPAPVVEEPAAVTPAPAYSALTERLATSPENLLRIIYILCGLIVLVALVLTTKLELKRHHLRPAMAAAFLLVIMIGSLVLADQLIFADPVLAEAAGL